MQEPAVEIVTDRLYALGGLVPLDGRISWFAPSATGYAPNWAYLLLDRNEALLIDSGLPAHRDAIVAQLGSLLSPESSLSILHTRIAEYDSVGNTAAICDAFPVERLLAHFPAGLLMDYESSSGTVPSAEEVVPSAGDPVMVSGNGGRAVMLLGAPLRLLLTFWAYDGETKTLFTSDSFGHVPLRDRSDPPVVTEADDATEPSDVRSHLYAKFDWLLAAERTALADELAAIFESHDIDAIAPMHGRVLKGRQVVERHHDLVQQALRN
jgi:flavorubredoxin